jgi:hypothetical protein
MPSGIPQPETDGMVVEQPQSPETEDMVVEESQSPETELDSEESSKFDGWDHEDSGAAPDDSDMPSASCRLHIIFLNALFSTTFLRFFVCTVFQLKDRFTVSFLSIPICSGRSEGDSSKSQI